LLFTGGSFAAAFPFLDGQFQDIRSNKLLCHNMHNPGRWNIEDKFTGLCLRCGNCIRTCPSKIIHPDTGQAGILGFLSPVLRYETDYCNEECYACTRVCPSGAIQSLNLEQKNGYVIGRAQLDRALCLWGISDCNACVNACPFDAIQIYWDKEAYESYPVADLLKCNGCGACEAYCPTGNIKAIKVRKRSPS